MQRATELASFHPGSKQGQETHASRPSVKKETRNSIDLDTRRPNKLAGKISGQRAHWTSTCHVV